MRGGSAVVAAGLLMLVAACGDAAGSGVEPEPLDGGSVVDGVVEPAGWGLRYEPDRSATQLELLVEERECASGRSAEGRIEVEVNETPEAISLAVGVRRLDGDQECPGNPRTPYRVELAEQVGDRVIRPPQLPLSDSEFLGRTATLTSREPAITVSPASETRAALSSWVEPRCEPTGGNDEEYLPLLDDVAEYRTEEMVVSAAVEQYGLPVEGWHVLRLSSPSGRDSSWWTQYRDGVAVAQVRVGPGLVGWSGHTSVCAGLGEEWTPDAEPGLLDSFEPRTTASRLPIDDWFESVTGLRHDGTRWRFERPDERCATWGGIETAALDNAATVTFTDWYAQWPDPIDAYGGSLRRDAAIGIALGDRGVMLVTEGEDLIERDLDDDLVWEDTSSLIPCLLDDPLVYTVTTS